MKSLPLVFGMIMMTQIAAAHTPTHFVWVRSSHNVQACVHSLELSAKVKVTQIWKDDGMLGIQAKEYQLLAVLRAPCVEKIKANRLESH